MGEKYAVPGGRFVMPKRRIPAGQAFLIPEASGLRVGSSVCRFVRSQKNAAGSVSRQHQVCRI